MPEQASGAAIIGGGIMGGDIAIIFAAAGWNVHVMSPSQHTRDALAGRIKAGLVELMKTLGKAPIWVKKDIPGFVGNRIQHAMMREAPYLIDSEVVTPEEVDTAVRYGFGFRFIACGPILQKEMSGWDTNYYVAQALYPYLHNETVPAPVVKHLIEKGQLGMKTKQGFWEWSDESMAKEKACIERALQAGFQILRSD